MRKLGIFMLRFVLVLIALGFAMYVFGPYEDTSYSLDFDDSQLDGGVDSYLAAREAGFADIRADSEKRVLWAGTPEAKTEFAVVNFHGFSANAQEIRPVPDNVALALGANLVFTRFQGHGRTPNAMSEATVSGWMADAAEALAIGRKVGDKIILITTSTGGTIAALALDDPQMQKQIAGVVFVSPNFGVNNPAAALLTMPAVRIWGPVVAGETRSFEPLNAGQGREWTTTYDTVATLPMAASVKEAVARDYSDVGVPALFYYAAEDQVVVAAETDRIAQEWGGKVTVVRPDAGEGVDPMMHVIAGDIMSPANTGQATDAIVTWVDSLP